MINQVNFFDSWGTGYKGGHELTHWDAGGEEFLFISDNAGAVIKTTLDGKELIRIEHPSNHGAYKEDDKFIPTETAIGPNGDINCRWLWFTIYFTVYGKRRIYPKVWWIGYGDDQFQTAHGICVDQRKDEPTLLITSRAHNSFKRFSLDGKYLETIFLPGAYVCRGAIDDQNLYAGVCWSRLKYLNQTPNSGFVIILDGDNKVVSNPGGTKPEYRNGKLQLMLQQQSIFNHCHDVCIEEDKNIYVCQWNANKTYPIKLERV